MIASLFAWMGDNIGIVFLILIVVVGIIGAIRGIRNPGGGSYNSTQDGTWWDND